MLVSGLGNKYPLDAHVAEQDYMPARIRSIAVREPLRPAIFYQGMMLSYMDLDSRSARAAALLAAMEAQPGDTIGVCVERSFGHVVACLAAMRIGCAFVMIDPNDPPERRAAILSDAGARILIADADHAQLHRGELLLMDDRGMTADPPEDPAEISDHPLSGEDIAYVVYTSGSTGTPKGVEITHANLANLVGWHMKRFDVREEDRASHLAGLGFDAAIWEVWPYLAAGASLALVDELTRTSPSALREWMVREGITIGFVPTALVEPMIAEPWPDDCRLRYLLTGGEALRTRPRAGLPFRFVNNYGPCECTVVATSGEVAPAGSPDVPDIGSPIDGVQVHILDEEGLPVPEGGEGEMWIGGRSVGRGYRNRPELNAAAFVPDPFGSAPEGMIYRTGDRAFRAPDGRIFFRGRADNQVKIRGVRIELDEVAANLQQHPHISSAVVTSREDEAGEQSLHAYFVAASESEGVEPEELRTFLSRSLPASHLPAAFVQVDAMPLTRNGKINVEALPDPPRPGRDALAGQRRAATPTQKRLAAIVESVLGIGDVPIDANFFMLGGHSLLATQVVIQSRETFDVDLTLRDLFDSPTIEGFAGTIEDRIAAKVATLSEEEVLKMLERAVS